MQVVFLSRERGHYPLAEVYCAKNFCFFVPYHSVARVAAALTLAVIGW